eukprot:scaffold2024_cov123-Skeletonema_marinoi.AAC.7
MYQTRPQGPALQLSVCPLSSRTGYTARLHGTSLIDNILFSISDPKDILRKARRKAVHDAKTKAESIVSELGCRLGRISCISTESGHSYPMPPMQMQHGSRSVGFSQHSTPLPTIATGENSYKVSVDITWEIIQTTSEI